MIISRTFLLFIVSFLRIGLISKKMPGTIASIFGMLLLFLMPRSSSLVLFNAIVTFLIGCVACQLYIVKYKYESDKDPRYAVIDEICGIFTGAFIIYHFGLKSNFDIFINFLLFRFFDILKPFPIKNIETLMKHNNKTIGLGIMLDDVIAGIFGAITQILIFYVKLCYNLSN